MEDYIKLVIVEEHSRLNGRSCDKLCIVANPLKDGAIMDKTIIFQRAIVGRSIGFFFFLYRPEKVWALTVRDMDQEGRKRTGSVHRGGGVLY